MQGGPGGRGQGAAMVVRDHHGECMYAATEYFIARVEATMAEAKALRWTLLRLQEPGIDALVIEMDSQLVVLCFMQQKVNEFIEPSLQDCRAIASLFHSFDLVHVKRTGNKVAHLLASLAFDFPNVCWWDNFPSQLSSAILEDVFSIII